MLLVGVSAHSVYGSVANQSETGARTGADKISLSLRAPDRRALWTSIVALRKVNQINLIS